MFLADTQATCKNLRCRKRFDISGVKTVAFMQVVRRFGFDIVPSYQISFLLFDEAPAAEAAGACKKSWSAPLPDKPSDRGLFGLAEDTAADGDYTAYRSSRRLCGF
jgi:hypothetical protein